MRWSMFDADAQLVLLDARRRTITSGNVSIRSAQLLAACLVAPRVTAELSRAGIDPLGVSDLLGEGPVMAQSDLLALVGVDLAAVRRAMPVGGAVPWQLRRWPTRPLRVTLDAPSSSVRFASSGRKVIEVALWHAKRHTRTASSLDLLRGVLSDGRDPINQCLVRDEPAARRLYLNLFEVDDSRI